MTKVLPDAVWKDGIELPSIRTFEVAVTRFNIRGRPNTPSAAPEWVKRRTEIFRSICLPSLVAQRRKFSLWLVLFDGREPSRVKKAIKLLAPYRWILPVWQGDGPEGPESLESCIRRSILSRMPEDTEYLLTTRVDNDDALSIHYNKMATDYAMAVIAKLGLADFWLSFPVGAQSDGRDERLFIHTRPHFLTRCSDAKAFAASEVGSVQAIQHSRIFDGNNRVFLPMTGTPAWLQYVHQQNIRNRLHAANLRLGEPSQIASLFAQPAARLTPRLGPLWRRFSQSFNHARPK